MEILSRISLFVASAAIAFASAPVFAGVTLIDFGTLTTQDPNPDIATFDDPSTLALGPFPGDPWTTHGVKYTQTYVGNQQQDLNLISPGPTSNVFSKNLGGAINGTFQNQYNLFGFDIGRIQVAAQDTASIVLFTNLNTNLGYTFSNLAASNLTYSFYGFRADAAAGEYFTGFTVTPGVSYAALDNVAVGFASAVPEPSNCALLLAGFGLLAGVGARRPRQSESGAANF